MKSLRVLYHLLGGVRFAIILIAATALFVIAGTLIESASQSHRYASLFTYDNILFSALLWGFFINILFAAIRRWPFRLRHIPFLITHLGLLMILAGVMVKRHYGLQGTMSLIEGSGSDQVMLPDTYAIALRSKANDSRSLLPLKKRWNGQHQSFIGKGPQGVTLRLAEFQPHAKSYLATWVKGQTAVIDGLAPMRIEDHDEKGILGPSGKVRFHQDQAPVWGLYALKANDPANVIEALASDRSRWPLLAVLEDHHGDVVLAAIDPNGKEWSTAYKRDGLDQLIAYDDGFGGYSVRAELPFASMPVTGDEMEDAAAELIEKQLRHALETHTLLSPPLQLLKEGCRIAGTDFPSTATKYLLEWHRSRRWIDPGINIHSKLVQDTIKVLPWSTIPREEYEGALLSVRLDEKIGDEIARGEDPLVVLRNNHWPLLAILEEQMKESEAPPVLTLLSRQLFMAARMMMQGGNGTLAQEDSGSLLSAYLSAYGLSFDAIAPVDESPEIEALVREKRRISGADPLSSENIAIETSIAQVFHPERPGNKLEDNVPMVTLQISKGKRAQIIRLGFDRSGLGLQWPALDGEYLLRFQNDQIVIPYRLRLRQARQINYANSTQPYSYESDLIIFDKREGKESEHTISMNKVHETPEGYRFYLSSISTPQEDNIKRVTIVVNYDPAKYWLTYPGAIVLTLGIILLFTLRPYRKRSDHTQHGSEGPHAP